ncbi:thymidine kinase [Aquipluma nitroreducens]|uniref:Thymidine kinase n=1 Tax=Aquipluma nitroreducens TaxID=2010828 RepID=A0A5K7S6R8_9BACT|nr:thymidine kinase [Aquipluma nitroreducens]BBE17226.1 thymidine kinase [Aquipluma nitroreducens]
MFIERGIDRQKKTGSIEVIAGSMFSGKTEELIRRLKRAKIARLKVEIFKPAIDTRYSLSEVVSHDENSILSTPVESSGNIMLLSGDVDVIGIDEAQFFDNGLIDVTISLANMGVRVIIAGLDMDFKGKPFGPIPGLMAVADHITKVHAICMRCGDVAQFSHRLSTADKLVLLGEKDEYEPLCRSCFTKATR